MPNLLLGTKDEAAADGKNEYLVAFTRFEGATDKTPGTVVMRVKGVQR